MDRLLKIVLLGLGALCLFLYGYLFWSRSTADDPEPTAAPPALAKPTVTLWDAYERALAAAQEAGPVEPLSASAQWQSVTQSALLDGAGQWSFKFYAPEAGGVLHLVVTPEEARLVKQTRASSVPAVLTEGAWLDGPRDPLLVFLARGGRDFLEQHPQAVVTVHLAAGEVDGPRWDVAALTTGDRSVLALRIDAESLQVLPTASEAGEGGGL